MTLSEDPRPRTTLTLENLELGKVYIATTEITIGRYSMLQMKIHPDDVFIIGRGEMPDTLEIQKIEIDESLTFPKEAFPQEGIEVYED